MKKIIVSLASALLCLALLAPASGAATIKPNLCETGCGGKWGAKEHALAYAKEAWPNHNPDVNWCDYDYTNESGVAQWTCGGEYQGYYVPWKVSMDPWGYKVGSVEFN